MYKALKHTHFYKRTKTVALAGIGASVCIFIIAQGAVLAPEYLSIIAPFGATMVILFALPHSPLAQPRNILGGHLLTSVVGLTCLTYWDVTPLSMAASVGVGVSLMMITNTLHPPAGANPLLILTIHASWSFLLVPVLSGCLIILIVGWLYHNGISRLGYPLNTEKHTGS